MNEKAPSTWSRREFGKVALAAVPLSVAALHGARLHAGGLAADSKVAGVRIGVQSYSFRTMPLEDAIKAMAEIGLGECELWSGHVEPEQRPPAAPQGGAAAKPDPVERERAREALRKWRLTTPLDHFTAVKKQFDAAKVTIQSYNLSFSENFTDEEIDRGFEMAKALGAKFITASATVAAAKKVAPFADKHRMTVAMHNHSNVKDPNQFATPESFAAALAFSKQFAVNLDIGHFVAAGYDPLAYIEQHHARITNLHLKDRKKDQGANVVWGEGDTPIKAALQLLKQKKYDIPANIEYEYKGEDAVAEVRKCFQFCKDALTTLGPAALRASP